MMDTMGDDLHALLAELREWGRGHGASQRRRGDGLRNLELFLPKLTPDAMLLATMGYPTRRRSQSTWRHWGSYQNSTGSPFRWAKA
jgi:hypothetical protein